MFYTVLIGQISNARLNIIIFRFASFPLSTFLGTITRRYLTSLLLLASFSCLNYSKRLFFVELKRLPLFMVDPNAWFSCGTFVSFFLYCFLHPIITAYFSDESSVVDASIHGVFWNDMDLGCDSNMMSGCGGPIVDFFAFSIIFRKFWRDSSLLTFFTFTFIRFSFFVFSWRSLVDQFCCVWFNVFFIFMSKKVLFELVCIVYYNCLSRDLLYIFIKPSSIFLANLDFSGVIDGFLIGFRMGIFVQ